MANKKLAEEDEADLWDWFKKVKMLIEELPEEIFRGDSYLEAKKKRAYAALEVLEKFFKMLSTSTIDQRKVKRFAQFCNEFPNFTTNLDGIAEMLSFACQVKHPTINID